MQSVSSDWFVVFNAQGEKANSKTQFLLGVLRHLLRLDMFCAFHVDGLSLLNLNSVSSVKERHSMTEPLPNFSSLEMSRFRWHFLASPSHYRVSSAIYWAFQCLGYWARYDGRLTFSRVPQTERCSWKKVGRYFFVLPSFTEFHGCIKSQQERKPPSTEGTKRKDSRSFFLPVLQGFTEFIEMKMKREKRIRKVKRAFRASVTSMKMEPLGHGFTELNCTPSKLWTSMKWKEIELRK